MANNRLQRPKTPELDMNPMVDMAFLLVTFFLLATTFKTADPARVVVPKSVSNVELPENKVISITLTRDGRPFMGLGDTEARSRWLESFAGIYELSLTEEEKEVFSTLSGFGVPSSELNAFLRLTSTERNQMRQPGIPMDSTLNEMSDWIIMARTVLPRSRVVIKADRLTPYKYVDDVINTLTDNNILRFNLITESKKLENGE